MDVVKNIFKVGPVVDGESFIGCEDVLTRLRNNIFSDCNSLSVVGMHRMGKTSLLNGIFRESREREEFISVFLDMQEYNHNSGDDSDYNEVLIGIIGEVENEIERKEIAPDKLYFLQKFKKARVGSNDFRQNFKKIFRELKEKFNLNTLLIMDEFDAAEKIFTQAADYEFFRTLVNPTYGTILILISRRLLYMIERRNENNSTFHGVFGNFSVIGFSENDIKTFRKILAERYEIDLTKEQMERIRYYSGRSPYIYSFFGKYLVDQKRENAADFDVDEIYKNNPVTVTQYADTLFSRLEKDKHLAKLIGVILGPKIYVTPDDVNVLKSMGYLNDSQDGYSEILSGYFTDYVKSKHFKDDSWNNILSVDTTLKDLIKKEFGELSDTEWKHYMEEAYSKFESCEFSDAQYQKNVN